ncbi:hypothetical protein SAMN03159341_102293 [Paenibacillus sp. 1_12]|uniref:hypothetical protein n=1 Tax=Paenibacillus sp. 1_12 TaxID=1566278 RepID=UPI0008F34832|nr:hypothetical protein [Paenibacillus sp. 1_12]SFK94279.1 hypothetical protein SAMN03159341_102293 [Paenibacillus sp. 1_12]
MSVQLLTAATADGKSTDTLLKFILISGFILNALLLAALIYLIINTAKLKKSTGFIQEPAIRSSTKKLAEPNVGQVIEKQILALASERGGTLSVVETAYFTKLSLELSHRALESFVTRGFAEIKEKKGATLYHFQGILTEYEKVTAKSLDDLLDDRYS